MTDTTRTRQLSIGRICLRAYQRAGILPIASSTISNEQAAYARDELDLMFTGKLSTTGAFARAVIFHTFETVDGTATYELPGETLDVIGTAVYIPEGQDVDSADSELPLRAIDRNAWQELGTKSATGTPTMYYINRSPDTIEAWLWPKPSEAGTVRLQLFQFKVNPTDANSSPDLEIYWTDYLAWELAYRIAESSSLDSSKLLSLASKAKEAFDLARTFSKQRAPQYAKFSHRTGWN